MTQDQNIPVATSTRRSRIAAPLWLGLGVACCCLVTAGGGMTSTDAVVAFDVTRNIVERHSVATSGNLIGNDAYKGSDGRCYSPFGIAQSIWNIPFFLAGRAVAQAAAAPGRSVETLEKATVALATVPAIAILAAICSGLLTRLGASPTRATTAVVILIFATPLWPYSKFGFNHPLCACFLWGAVLAIESSRERRGQFAAGVLTGMAMLTRHEMLLAAPILAAYGALGARAPAAAALRVLTYAVSSGPSACGRA